MSETAAELCGGEATLYRAPRAPPPGKCRVGVAGSVISGRVCGFDHKSAQSKLPAATASRHRIRQLDRLATQGDEYSLSCSHAGL